MNQAKQSVLSEAFQTAAWVLPDGGFHTPEGYLKEFGRLFTPERVKQEVDFLESRLRLTPGARVLDCACGPGRHAVELARRGYRVTGVDFNPVYLGMGAQRAREAGVAVQWIEADIRGMPLDEEFDAVINMHTAFGLLGSDEADFACLRSMAARVAPGGRLVIEVINRENILYGYRTHVFHAREDDDIHVVSRFTFDLARSVDVEERIRVWRAADGSWTVEKTGTEVRLYTLPEFRRMFGEVGLVLEDALLAGDFDGQALTLHSPRCIVVGTARSG